jgi:hypothetical protein
MENAMKSLKDDVEKLKSQEVNYLKSIDRLGEEKGESFI